MPGFIADPRREARVSVELPIEITFQATTWKALSVDLGPGGCQLGATPPLAERARIVLSLHGALLLEPLVVSASVAWVRGGRCGLAFITGHRGADPREWFRRLVASDPRLAKAAQTPTRLDLDARLTRATALASGPLNADEQRLLSLVEERTPARVLRFRAQLPPHYFARALFTLLGKGVVLAPGVRSVGADGAAWPPRVRR